MGHLVKHCFVPLHGESRPERVERFRGPDGAERPGGVGADDGVRLLRETLSQCLTISGIAAIPQHDSGVSRQSLTTGTSHCGPTKSPLKALSVHPEKRHRIGRGLEAARREIRISRLARESHVPGTNVLTDVAAIYQRANRLSPLCGDDTTLFDGQVRDAPRGVEYSTIANGGRRARIDASPAC